MNHSCWSTLGQQVISFCNTAGKTFSFSPPGGSEASRVALTSSEREKVWQVCKLNAGLPCWAVGLFRKKLLWGGELAVTLWHVNGRVKSEHNFQGRSSSSGKLQISVRTESNYILCCLLMNWCLFLRLFLWMKVTEFWEVPVLLLRLIN